MKTICIIQSRMGSKRLPGKALRDIGGTPMIIRVVERARESEVIDEVVVATTSKREDDSLVGELHRHGIPYFRGSEEDVLERYYQCAQHFSADIVVRVTGDCPFIDAKIIDQMWQILCTDGLEYITNRTPPTFPDGLDVELFSIGALKEAYSNTTSYFEREHVTPYFYSEGKVFRNFAYHKDLSNFRLTVDDASDLKIAKLIVEDGEKTPTYNFLNAVDFLKTISTSEKQMSKRDEGALLGSGQKLWRRAKQVIPTGNHLLSKKSEQHLPGGWPSYFTKCQGINIWDLDGHCYRDFHLMGVGTNILGYANPQVDQAVRAVIDKGNLSTLNAPEEVELAELLLAREPWAQRVRFARTGGEASAIATRLGRAATGRQNVAVCGYHGWHDWYLAANLKSGDSLSKLLLPGLKTAGIPTCLEQTVHTFKYNDSIALENLIAKENIGVIQMEVMRNEEPEDGFLETVRALADRHGIVLIFDECSSGFRETNSGLYKKYNIVPDIVIYGKTLGNGYAITAIVGTEEVMSFAEDSFVSSTFWTERIGFSAAIATLKIMDIERPWDIVTTLGAKVQENWVEMARKCNLNISVNGIPGLSSFTFNHENHLKYKTYITQEMLKQSILASNVFYPSAAHTDEDIDSYLYELKIIFDRIADFESGICDVDKYLEFGVAESGFGRLN